LHNLFELTKLVWEDSELDEDDRWHAGRMMQIMISYLHGSPHIGQYIEAMIGIAVTSLLHEAEKPFEHDYVRAEVFNIINMAMFYNPVQVIEVLERVPTADGEKLTSKLFGLMFHRIEEFRGLHNRRLPILALCRLVEQGLNNLPESIQQMSPHLLPILLTLFEGLGWAYTAKAEEDGSDDEGDDDEEDDDAQLADAAARGIDVEELENLEDEEDYDESEVHRIASELAFNLEDMGNDEFEEGQFSRFRTLIDTKEKDPAFDEYGAFMRVLDDFSQRGILASAMSNLTPEQGETLQEVKTEAEKRAELYRSTELREQGGFKFGNPQMPSQFSFQ